MKILVLIHEYPPFAGGGGVHAQDIVEDISKRHNIVVIAPRVAGQTGRETKGNLTIIRVPVLGRVNAESQQRWVAYISFFSFVVSGFFAAWNESRKNRFNLIHSFFAIPAGLIGWLVSSIRKLPHTVTLIEGDLFTPDENFTRPFQGPLKLLIQKIIRSSSGQPAISTYIRDAVVKHYTPELDIAVINPGIPSPESIPKGANFSESPPPEINIISIGRLVKRKGFEDLIRAFTKLDQSGTRLIIIGSGPEKENLESLAKRLNPQSKILFPGGVSNEEKQKLLISSHIFALTSIHEGFGIVFVEAMACGMPLIGTTAGGQSDIISEGNNGFLVPRGDINRLVEHLQTLIKDTQLRKQMSLASRKMAGKFANELTASKYEILFKQCTNGN